MAGQSETVELWREIQDLRRQLSMLAEAPRVRTRLTGNLTLYVRTDGSDANNGRANTAAGAFATIQKAVNVASFDYDTGIYQITIQIGAGIYDQGQVVLWKHPHYKSIRLLGDQVTPSNVIIRPPGVGGTVFLLLGTWDLLGFQAQRNPAGGDITCFIGYGPACQCTFSNVHIGAVGSSGRHFQAEEGAKLYILTAYTVTTSGLGFAYHFVASWPGSAIYSINAAATFVGAGAIAAGAAFAFVGVGGAIFANGMTFLGDAGSITGLRYKADALGQIGCGGLATFFPGNVNGAPTNGAIYI